MRKRPFLLLACMLGAGIGIQSAGRWLWLVPVLLFIVGITVVEKLENDSFLLTVLLLFFLGLGLLRAQQEMQFKDQYLPRLWDGQKLRLSGEITHISSKSKYFTIQLSDCTIYYFQNRIPCNDVLVYTSDDHFSVGQFLIVDGTISLFEKRRNEGNFDALMFYQSQKIDFGLWMTAFRVCDGLLCDGVICDEVICDEVICDEALCDGALCGESLCEKKQGGISWLQILTTIKQGVHIVRHKYRNSITNLRNRLLDSLRVCGDEEGILSAMLLGEKNGLNQEVKSLYQLAGISHILAISGLHVSLLGMGIYRFLRKRGIRYLFAGGLTAFIMYTYAVMTGTGISTRRAVGMLFVFLLGDLLGRSYDLLSSLGAIVVVMLLDNPFLLYNTAFWLSVVAVFGVGVMSELEKNFSADISNGDTRRLAKIRASLCMSLGIQLFTLPIIAYSYFEIPIYSVFLNLLVLSVVKYVVGFGALASIAGLFLPWLGSGLLFPAEVILNFYSKLSEFFLSLPFSRLLLGQPTLLRIGLYYICLVAAICLLYKKYSLKRLVTMFVILLVFLAFRTSPSPEVVVLDVGQGDAIYLHSSSGMDIFIDGGSLDVKQVGEYRILPFLKSRAIKEIDYWFVSHADADHTSGVMELLQLGYPIRNLIVSKSQMEDERMQKIISKARENKVTICPMYGGERLQSEDTSIRILWPFCEAKTKEIGEEALKSAKDGNEQSLVLLYEDNGFRAMFAGDISSEVEREILKLSKEQKEIDLSKLDLYKCNHHGSKYSSCIEWIQALSPKQTTISYGEGNLYGHPHEETLEKLKGVGSEVFTTQDHGAVTVNMEK